MPRKARAATETPTAAPVAAPPTPDSLDHTAEFAPFDTVVPLSLLRLSDLNVRRTGRDADVASLAEDIAARGLKTNLNVIPAHFSTMVPEGDETSGAGLFEVAGGGRRAQAMMLLAAAGRLPADHPVSVKIEPRGEARETSLSENLHRVAMNPADEFEAFAAIVAQSGVESCARRFGVTVRRVEERLRLAALAPELLEALRSGALSLDSAKAYAGTEDHDLQRKIFAAQDKQFGKSHTPREVREAIRGRTLPLSDGRVVFATLAAYRAAGGTTEAEMFMGSDGEERVTGLALLDRLCAEKAAGLIPALAAGEGWASGQFVPGCGWTWTVPKPPKGFELYRHEYNTPSPEEQAAGIALYTVAFGGAGLRRCSSFKPTPSEKPDAGVPYKVESEEDRAAGLREEGIALWAARLAVGSFAGTPLEARAFWPNDNWHAVEYEFGEDSDFDEGAEPVSAVVTIKIRVEASAIAAAREQGEAKYDAELAVEAARQAEAEAAKSFSSSLGEGDHPQDGGGEDSEPGEEKFEDQEEDA